MQVNYAKMLKNISINDSNDMVTPLIPLNIGRIGGSIDTGLVTVQDNVPFARGTFLKVTVEVEGVKDDKGKKVTHTYRVLADNVRFRREW